MTQIKVPHTHFNGTAAFGKPCRRCGSMERFVKHDQCAECSRRKARLRLSKTYLERSVNHARRRAREEGREFNIALDGLPVPELCPVFGTPIEKPSLMLLDRTKGYTPENVRVVSWRANQLKSSGSLAELTCLVDFLARAMQSASDGDVRDPKSTNEMRENAATIQTHH